MIRLDSGNLSLTEALGIGERELVALVGGGGKTSLLFALAAELTAAGRGVVLTTTTRIAAAEAGRAPTLYHAEDLADERETALRAPTSPGADGEQVYSPAGPASTRLTTPCLVLGASGPEKAQGVPLDLPRRLLARPEVDVVVVEADGAKMLPVKAPAPHEPAVPAGTTLFVCLMGIDALERPLHAAAHRPHLVATLTGRAPTERLRPADAATLLTHPAGGLKGAPAEARVLIFLNKVETAGQRDQASRIAEQALAHPRVERVVLGALQSEKPVRALFRKASDDATANGAPSGVNDEPT